MKTIIELAKKAGFPDPTISANWFETLERFDALVRAEAFAEAKEHFGKQLVGLRASVREQALEEAAKVCDSVNNYDNPMTATDCAAAIRGLI